MKDRAGTYKECCITCRFWGSDIDGEYHLRGCRIINKDTPRHHHCNRHYRDSNVISMLSVCSNDERYKDAIDAYKVKNG